MSATGRGYDRIAADNYPTPVWCVRRMLEAAPWHRFDGREVRLKILEPCAGEGLIVKELRNTYPSSLIGANELRSDLATQTALRGAGATTSVFGDAFNGTPWPQMDLVFTNPPFSLWHDFARKGLESAVWTALLLRIGAAAHLEGLPTPSLYILPNRPIFAHKIKCIGEFGKDGCGFETMIPFNAAYSGPCPKCDGFVFRRAQTDASEYAWLVWGPQAPTVRILAKTPLSERKPPPRGLEIAA